MTKDEIETLEARLARSAVLARQIQCIALARCAGNSALADTLDALSDVLAERLEADAAFLEART